MTAEAWIAALVGIAATVDDLARRRISNWIPGCAFAAGLCLQTVHGGWRGAGSALLGTASGAGVFLIFYLLGGMGGGDIKLMAGFGAVLGSQRLFEAALWTAGCGGLMAVLFLAAHYLRGLWQSRNGILKPAEAAGGVQRADTIPYAPAIAVGVWLSLVPKS